MDPASDGAPRRSARITFGRALAGSLLSAAVLMAGAGLAPSGQDAPKPAAEKGLPEETMRKRAESARESWWAYKPLVAPAVPPVRDGTWARSDIDRFLLAKMEAKGLRPAPEADRVALIRRAALDLTGLPPTPEEIDAFVGDGSPDAYERLIDRLLASPHYGEKWGRHWLDLVRYADTNGFERDSDKEAAWKYRDFVVRALNDDMPYARFVRAQIAGDELADRDFDTLVATGFFRLGLWDDEVPDLKQALADDLDGMVDTTARTFLATSMGCARCHDHKGDPIRIREYYQFAAFFAGVAPYKESPFNSIEADNVLRMVRRDFGKADPEAEIAAYIARRDAIVAELRALDAAGADSAAGFPDLAPADGLLAHLRFEDAKSATAVNAVDAAKPATVRDAGFGAEGRIGRAFRFDAGDDRVEIERPVGDDFTISFFFRSTDVGGGSDSDRRWFLGKGLVDGEIPGIVRDFGVSYIANGYVSAGTGDPETFVSSGPGHNDGRWHHVAFTRSRKSGDITLFVDGVAVDRARGSKARLDAPRKLSIGAMLPGGGAFAGDIDEVRFYDRVLGEDEVRSVALGVARPTSERRAAIASRSGDDAAKRFDELHAQLAALRAPDWKGETVLAVRENGAPRETRIMQRGNPHSLGDVVEPAVPVVAARAEPAAAVKPAHGESSGRRLALADWIVDPRNGLAWRTIANRLWQHHFGKGIVPTPNDFGRLGEQPTHPELLDHLASRLVAHGGSLKAMHREIMLTSAYRMSSVPDAEALAKDAPNELLTRFRMRRLTAEELRDSMLVANGTFNAAVGGPPVLPPMPREVLETSSRPGEVWPLTPEESWTRRSLYIKLKRSLQHPLLSSFDLADLDSPCPERFATVVPTQSLSMMNGDLTNEEAAKLARRLERERPGDLRAQVALGRRLTSGRAPDARELEEAVAFVAELKAEEGLDDAKALDSLCLVLLNLNEFLYID
jgi:plasmid stability protein